MQSGFPETWLCYLLFWFWFGYFFATTLLFLVIPKIPIFISQGYSCFNSVFFLFFSFFSSFFLKFFSHTLYLTQLQFSPQSLPAHHLHPPQHVPPLSPLRKEQNFQEWHTNYITRIWHNKLLHFFCMCRIIKCMYRHRDEMSCASLNTLWLFKTHWSAGPEIKQVD